jgi:hypothetical protein
MKPVKILAVLCILSGFYLEGVKAQITPASSYQITNRISSLQIGNLSPAQSWLDTSQINCRVNKVPILTGSTKNSGFTINATRLNQSELIDTYTLLNWADAKSPAALAGKENYGTTGTFKIKWESLHRIPFIDPAMAYSCPIKRTDELTWCNSRLYRTAAFIIPRMLQFHYPGAQNTVIYSPAYLNPNYSYIERSK